MNTNNELCAWLRDHSAGVYRPAAEAATLIEQQDKIIAELRAALTAAPVPAYPYHTDQCAIRQTKRCDCTQDAAALVQQEGQSIEWDQVFQNMMGDWAESVGEEKISEANTQWKQICAYIDQRTDPTSTQAAASELTDEQCHSIQMDCSRIAEEWADSQSFEPTISQVDGIFIRAIIAATRTTGADQVRDAALEDAACLVKAGCGYNWNEIADALRALKSAAKGAKA